MRSFVAIALGTLVYLAPVAASANVTYTFAVPVSAKQLPSGSSLVATCTVFAGANGAGAVLGSAATLPLSQVNGAFTGNANVALSIATPGASYKCFLLVYQGAATGQPINISVSSATLTASGGTMPPGWSGNFQTGATNF